MGASNDNIDARLSVGLPGHPKTKKLVRRLGQAAAWNLVVLILWARANKPDGDLSGMSIEDIELASDWTGDNDQFVAALASVGFLDGVEGEYRLHDWAEHQPWSSGSEARSEKSKWAALCKRHGRKYAEAMMPDYAARQKIVSNDGASGTQNPASGTQYAHSGTAKSAHSGATGSALALPNRASGMPEGAQRVPLADSGSAPSPSPLPIPSPLPTDKKKDLVPTDGETPPDPEPPEPKLELRNRTLGVRDLVALGVVEQHAQDWLAVRKAKKAPLTPTALDGMKLEAGKAGITLAEAVRIAAKRNWQGFKASWDWREDDPPTRPSRTGMVTAGEKDYTAGVNPDGSF